MKANYSFRCPECSQITYVEYDISTEDVEYYDMEETHGEMLAMEKDPTRISMIKEGTEECGHCEAQYQMYMEYNAFGFNIEIYGVDERDIRYSDVEFESYYDWLAETGMATVNLEEDVYKNFRVSIADLERLITKADENNGAATLNRMIFVQLVSAFEAYIGDSLTNSILSNEEYLLNFLKNNKDLNMKKFTLLDIFTSKDLVKLEVQKYLSNQIYHQLSKTEALYFTSIGIKFPVEDSEKDNLYKVMVYRHDCVHRNGFDKQGKRLVHFSVAYLSEVVSLFSKVVDRIQDALEGKDA